MISVLVPVWNAKDTLGEALASVAAQTFTDYEVVVVDDGSTDGTFNLLQEWSARDSRVRALSHGERRHLGTPATRNATVRAARGDIAAFLDADDRLEPGALETYDQTFRAQPGVGVVYGEALTFGGGVERKLGRGAPRRAVHAFAQLARSNPLATSATAIKREALGADPFPLELPLCQDWACWLEVARRWPFFFVPEILARHRAHAASVTGQMIREGRRLEYDVLQAAHLRRAAQHYSAAEQAAVKAGLEHRATEALLLGFSALRRGRLGLAARWMRAGLRMPLTLAGRARAMLRVAPAQRGIWRGEEPPLAFEPIATESGADPAGARPR